MTGADGNVAGVAVFARDITAERLEKEELARKTREFDRIFQAIPDLYFRMDKDGVFLDYRASNESLLFRPPGEFIGKKLLDVLPLEAGEAIYQSIRDVIRTKHEKTLKYTLPLPHGMVWFEARILPADRGEVVAVVRDVTGMRKAEERARSNEARFQAIAAAVQDALVVVDDTGVVTFWNAAAERVFGYTEQEVLGEKIHGLLTVDLDPVFMEGRFRVFAASGGGPVIGRTVEMVMRRKNGELFPAELSISSFRMDGVTMPWEPPATSPDGNARRTLSARARNNIASSSNTRPMSSFKPTSMADSPTSAPPIAGCSAKKKRTSSAVLRSPHPRRRCGGRGKSGRRSV